MLVLILNFLVFTFASYFISKKYQEFNIISLLFVAYGFFALFALIIYETPIYIYTSLVDISFYPFLLFYVCVLIFFSPVIKFNFDSITQIIKPKQYKFDIVLFIFLVFSLLVIILNFSSIFSLNNFNDAYESGKIDAVIVVEKGFNYYVKVLYSVFYAPCLLMLFYYIAFEKNKRFKIYLLLFATVFPKIILATIAGSRGVLYFLFFDFLICFLMFKKFIAKRIISRILFFILIFFVFALSVSILISFDRFGNGAIALEAIARYFGEPFLNYASIFWGYTDKLMGGEFNFGNFFGTSEKINNTYPYFLFKTFVGSLIIDFGVWGTILFCIILSIVFYKMFGKIKNQTIFFYNLMIFFFYYRLCFYGIFGFIVEGWSYYISFILIYLFFRINFKRDN